MRKLGGTTVRSIGHIARSSAWTMTRILSTRDDMLAELRDDNQAFGRHARGARAVREHNDVATASLIEAWIDETERRIWFLYEATRRGDPSGH